MGIEDRVQNLDQELLESLGMQVGDLRDQLGMSILHLDLPPSPEAERKGYKGLNAYVISGIPLSEKEAKKICLDPRADGLPHRVTMAFVCGEDFEKPDVVGAGQQVVWARAEARRVCRAFLGEEDPGSALNYLWRIAKNVLGLRWTTDSQDPKEITRQVELLNEAIAAEPSKEIMIVFGHGGGIKKHVGDKAGLRVELLAPALEKIGAYECCAVIDGTCCRVGVIPDLGSYRGPYFGALGGVSIIEAEKSVYICNGVMYRWDIEAQGKGFKELAEKILGNG